MATDSPPVLGLIGAIGAGKSTAARLLALREGRAIACDRLGHQALLEPEVLAVLVARWGERILLPDGTSNRREIGSIVFAEPAERRFLESVVFPAIGGMVEREMERHPAAAFFVLDAATLLEAGWAQRCDKILYVDAPRTLRLQRVEARNGWDEGELDRREAAQWPAERKKRFADAIVLNDDTEAELAERMDRRLRDWGWIAEKDGHDA